jgi:hypothetical protein
MSDCPRCNHPEQYGCGCTTQEMNDWRADEITALQARLAEVENTLGLADDQRREWEAHCKAALTAQLATARRDALEEAAKVCDERGAAEQVNYGLNRGTQNYFRARDAIRALIAQEDAAQKGDGE